MLKEQRRDHGRQPYCRCETASEKCEKILESSCSCFQCLSNLSQLVQDTRKCNNKFASHSPAITLGKFQDFAIIVTFEVPASCFDRNSCASRAIQFCSNLTNINFRFSARTDHSRYTIAKNYTWITAIFCVDYFSKQSRPLVWATECSSLNTANKFTIRLILIMTHSNYHASELGSLFL